MSTIYFSTENEIETISKRNRKQKRIFHMKEQVLYHVKIKSSFKFANMTSLVPQQFFKTNKTIQGVNNISEHTYLYSYIEKNGSF